MSDNIVLGLLEKYGKMTYGEMTSSLINWGYKTPAEANQMVDAELEKGTIKKDDGPMDFITLSQ